MTFPNIAIGLIIGLCVFVFFAFLRINKFYKFLLGRSKKDGKKDRSDPSESEKQSLLFDSISSGEVSVWSVLGPLVVFIAIVIIAGIVLIILIISQTFQTLPK